MQTTLCRKILLHYFFVIWVGNNSYNPFKNLINGCSQLHIKHKHFFLIECRKCQKRSLYSIQCPLFKMNCSRFRRFYIPFKRGAANFEWFDSLKKNWSPWWWHSFKTNCDPNRKKTPTVTIYLLKTNVVKLLSPLWKLCFRNILDNKVNDRRPPRFNKTKLKSWASDCCRECYQFKIEPVTVRN